VPAAKKIRDKGKGRKDRRKPIITMPPEVVFGTCICNSELEPGNEWPCWEHHFPFVLRDYQESGVQFLRDNKRAMITDAPGLGKTPQAAFAAQGERILIVCPNYLVEQWAEWLKGEDEKSIERNHGRVIPNVEGTVVACVGNRLKKYRAIRAGARWTVINQESLQPPTPDNQHTMGKYILDQHYDTVIFDEAHHYRRRQSNRAKMAIILAKKTERVYLLTATPIYREVDDLFNQFRMLQPDIFTSYNEFVKTFCVADETFFGLRVVGVKKSMIKELEALLDIVRIGRSYADAGRQLPPIIEKYVKIEMPEPVKKMYKQAIEEYRIEALDEKFTNWMSVFHHLRRIITGAFKYDAVKDLLADEVRKAVVFSWYQDTADQIAERFGDMVTATGTDKVSERRAKAHGDKHVSATIAAMAEGIDLSDARSVIFAEENWTPGSNYQALSRVRRERQSGRNDEPVVVTYVHVKGTIDEVIHRRSKSREGTIKEVVREALFN